MTKLRHQMVTTVTELDMPSSRVLRACQRRLFTGVTAQTLPSLLEVRGQLRTRTT